MSYCNAEFYVDFINNTGGGNPITVVKTGRRRLQERDAKGGRPWPKPSGLMKHRRLDI